VRSRPRAAGTAVAPAAETAATAPPSRPSRRPRSSSRPAAAPAAVNPAHGNSGNSEPGARPPHETFYYYRGLRLEAVRHGDWKLRLPGAAGDNRAGTAAKNNADAAAAEAKPESPKLYHLKTDIGETTDAAAAHPEIVAKLEALVARMKDDLGLDGLSPGSRPLGKVETAAPLIGHDGKVRQGLESVLKDQ